MATKKQKHARAVAKREAFEEALRLEGLEHLRKEREHRRNQELADWEANHLKNHSWTKRIVECPHCRNEMKAAKGAELSSIN